MLPKAIIGIVLGGILGFVFSALVRRIGPT